MREDPSAGTAYSLVGSLSSRETAQVNPPAVMANSGLPPTAMRVDTSEPATTAGDEVLHVLLPGRFPKVVRADARTVSAGVVDLCAIGNRSVVQLV